MDHVDWLRTSLLDDSSGGHKVRAWAGCDGVSSIAAVIMGDLVALVIIAAQIYASVFLHEPGDPLEYFEPVLIFPLAGYK